MGFPQACFELLPNALWWLCALIAPCLLALTPSGSAQKGGRP